MTDISASLRDRIEMLERRESRGSERGCRVPSARPPCSTPRRLAGQRLGPRASETVGRDGQAGGGLIAAWRVALHL